MENNIISKGKNKCSVNERRKSDVTLIGVSVCKRMHTVMDAFPKVVGQGIMKFKEVGWNI